MVWNIQMEDFMSTELSRAKLQTRYILRGELVLNTALHLGAGRTPAKGTDSPVMRDGWGRPFIPGSSIKGAVRAAVERIVPNFNNNKIRACGLFDPGAECLSAMTEEDPLRKDYRKLQEALGQEIKRDELKNAIAQLLPDYFENENSEGRITEKLLLTVLERDLCSVCKAFGSPFISSSVFFHDAPIVEERWVGITQIRDGVGIDRDSGRAVDKLKYDYEVVPPDTPFQFSMTIETDDPISLGLVALGLHELVNGNIPLGGIRSRGLGRCRLDSENTSVETVEFGNAEALKAYLTEGKTRTQSIKEFIDQHISNLWNSQGGSHV
ncbi:MAG: CRISPR-associated RAMP protein [Methanobacteriota archaeon]|nr:MAG: CRISPR-associated RAMP protein [Euryarchaeota archaeon]